MTIADDFLALKNAYEANKVEVQTDVANLLAKVTDLSGQIAAFPNISPDIAALTAEIVGDTTTLHASVTPAAPVVTAAIPEAKKAPVKTEAPKIESKGKVVEAKKVEPKKVEAKKDTKIKRDGIHQIDTW